jgi:metal-responsive CopG/Arc/MetJ family transcriptional regulator
MGKAVKFAVSMPEEDFKEIEAIRFKEGVSRSKVILEAFELLKKSRVMEERIRKYEEGYRKMPERPHEMKAWEDVSLAGFSDEGWQ